MNFKIIPALLLACVLACRGVDAQPVTITVNYENVVGNTIQFYADDDLDWVGHVRKVVQAEDNGFASFMVELDKPGYYSLHHNTVWLSPGDELTANLSNYRNRSTFEGRGAEANNYLKNKSWPALKEGFGNFGQYKEILDARLAEANAALDRLQNVSEEFKRLERKSLKVSYAGSILDYALKGDKEYGEAESVLQPLLKEITGDDEYLASYQSRNLFTRIVNNPRLGVTVSPRAKELYEVSRVAQNLRERISPEQYGEYMEFGQGIASDDIRGVFMARLRKVGGLLPGRPAPDSDLVDRHGNPVKLSAYKGKPIYIDVWATWCGPCIAEGPHYRELCDRYPGVQFIAVSVDDERDKWEKYIEEHVYENVTELIAQKSSAFRDDWGISGIPHFILIDGDFNIVLPDAPRPRQNVGGILDGLAGSQAPRHATLYVTTAGLRETTASISYDGQETLIMDTFTEPVEAGRTEPLKITVEMNKPGYYMIFRNPLYLSPGDELTIDLRDGNQETVIGGTQGVEANEYLKNRYYSKGGSFLRSGRVLRDETEDMIAELRRLGAERQRQLDELTGVSDEFRRLEEIRIKADLANSMFSYTSYNREKMIPEDLTRETYSKFINDYHAGIKDFMLPLLREIASDDSYLDIEVVRLVLSQARDMDAYREIRLSDRFIALLDVYDKAREISGNMDKAKYDELRAYGEQIPYEDMKAVYMEKLAANSRLMEGMPAIEVALRDADGKKLKLSDLADKPMYVDIWATWCAPCLAESPYFEALSREYPGIAFVALSVDGDTAAWERSVGRKEHRTITEVLATDDMRRNWDITGIPRFLLIDGNFNIISADAPRPSQDDAIRPLLEKYSQKP